MRIQYFRKDRDFERPSGIGQLHKREFFAARRCPLLSALNAAGEIDPLGFTIQAILEIGKSGNP